VSLSYVIFSQHINEGHLSREKYCGMLSKCLGWTGERNHTEVNLPHHTFSFTVKAARMASRAGAAALDFPRIISSLKLGKETVAALQAFRKRHHDASLARNQLAAQPTNVDISYYRSILKNTAIVDEAERVLQAFKPVTYDVSAHVKAVEAFEVKAVDSAQQTVEKLDEELKALKATLANIEQARPFEDLTVNDVGNAHPEIFKAVDTGLIKGKWTVPGYKEKFGDLSLL